jgi:hypothetical protein
MVVDYGQKNKGELIKRISGDFGEKDYSTGRRRVYCLI